MTKVKGHATETDVDQGRVRAEDKTGNAEAELLLTWVGSIGLRRSWMSGGPWSM